MSENLGNVLGGEFATARRGSIDGYELGFISSRSAAGVSAANIARMLGRNEGDVRPHMRTPPKTEEPAPPAPVVVTWPVPPKSKAVRAILDEVAERYDVTVEDICGPRRFRAIALPRQEAMWRLMQVGRWSTTLVGEWLGGRDHTTVIHGCRAHQRRVDEGVDGPEAIELEARRLRERERKRKARRGLPRPLKGENADWRLWDSLRRPECS